jgi:hypothetical protein
MGQKWQVRSVSPTFDSEPVVATARTLEWAEIAGLIEVSSDGSWRPTAFGKAQLLKLEGAERGQSGEITTH